MSTPNDTHELIAQLRADINALQQRLRELEAQTGIAAAAPAPAIPARAPEELIAILSATVAAYLGYRPRIRSIRLIGSPGWAQQGRVSIQASHLPSLLRK